MAVKLKGKRRAASGMRVLDVVVSPYRVKDVKVVQQEPNSSPVGINIRRPGVSVPKGWVLITCSDVTLSSPILVRLGPEVPEITAGFGGWEIVPRPRQVGMTIWNGVEPYQLTFQIVFEGLRNDESQETVIGNLMRIAHGDDDSEPGSISVDGIPSLPADEWIIEGLDFGDYLRGRSTTDRVRQFVTLTCRELIEPKYVSIKEGALARPKAKVVTYKTKKGDTPAKIAKAKGTTWTKLRDLNKTVIKKANQVLKANISINVPVKEDKASKTKTKAKTRG